MKKRIAAILIAVAAVVGLAVSPASATDYCSGYTYASWGKACSAGHPGTGKWYVTLWVQDTLTDGHYVVGQYKVGSGSWVTVVTSTGSLVFKDLTFNCPVVVSFRAQRSGSPYPTIGLGGVSC